MVFLAFQSPLLPPCKVACPSGAGSLYLLGYLALVSTVCLFAVAVAAAVAGAAADFAAAAAAAQLGIAVLVVAEVEAEFGQHDVVFESVASDLQARNQPFPSYLASQMPQSWASPDLGPS